MQVAALFATAKEFRENMLIDYGEPIERLKDLFSSADKGWRDKVQINVFKEPMPVLSTQIGLNNPPEDADFERDLKMARNFVRPDLQTNSVAV